MASDAKRVSHTEIQTEAILGNVVAAVATALRPGAMIVLPILGAILLPTGVPLPSALLPPTVLLLPNLRLLLGALGRRIISVASGGIVLPFGVLLLLLLRSGLLGSGLLLRLLGTLLPLLRRSDLLLSLLLDALLSLLALLRLRLLLMLLCLLLMLRLLLMPLPGLSLLLTLL